MRERQLIFLQEAIYKMSDFPAECFRLTDRGRISLGLAADIVVFDPESVADPSTWFDPVQSPVGVKWVLVNGVSVVKDGNVTGQLPGSVLRQHR